jgi:inorganic pyrophosphatase
MLEWTRVRVPPPPLLPLLNYLIVIIKMFDVIIEMPEGSSRVKYEHDGHALRVDRFLQSPMFYPANYGFVKNTLGPDGDPCDALVITPVPLLAGCVITCRAIGLLSMEDDGGQDDKIISVPAHAIEYTAFQDITDVPKTLLSAIKHFFEHYKDLEPGKWASVSDFQSITQANHYIKRYTLS